MRRFLIVAFVCTLSCQGSIAQSTQEPAVQMSELEQQAADKLKARGYFVNKIVLDVHKEQTVLRVLANRGKNEYEILMSYPALKIIRERRI